MSDEIKNRLICAARQFRHNSDNSPDIFNPKEGFVVAYDKDEIDDLVSGLQSEVERLRGRCEFLEGSIKNAIGWIDGDLRDIIRDVGNQICSYNDLYESADRIEHLLAEALRQQAAESEHG